MEGQRGAALAMDSGSGARTAATRGLRDQTAGDARRTRGGDSLKTVGHCSFVLVNQRRLTAIHDGPSSPNPLVNSENSPDTSCSPKYRLQFMLKDQDLILNGSRVISSQSRLDQTDIAF